jgi:hypothetical protein
MVLEEGQDVVSEPPVADVARRLLPQPAAVVYE